MTVPDSAQPPDELAPEVAGWLARDDGLEAVAAATDRLEAGGDALQVASWLASEGIDPGRRAAALAAAEARRRARDRWPDADRLLFTRAGLEQASDPAVSAWRARRFAGAVAVEDRAAGIGGDTLALGAATGRTVTAVDRDAGRLTLLAHNARVRGVAVDPVVADALTHPAPGRGPIHADPGRRVGERRVRRLDDHQPSVPALLDHLAGSATGPGVAVVTSPAVDLADPDLPVEAEVEFVQLGRDLVEAVIWTGSLHHEAAQATATLLDDQGRRIATATRGERAPTLPVGACGEVLLEVAPAAVRARLHDQLAQPVGARRLARRRALLTVDHAPPPSPWWTARQVVGVVPARPAAVRRWLRAHDERPVELVRHGVDLDLVAFARGLGRPARGPQGWRVELVRTDDGAVAVITDAVPLVGQPGREART